MQIGCPHYKNNMCLWGGDGADAVCGYDVPERNRTTEMKAEPCQKLRMERKLCPLCAGTGREHDDSKWLNTPCSCQDKR